MMSAMIVHTTNSFILTSTRNQGSDCNNNKRSERGEEEVEKRAMNGFMKERGI